MVVLYQNELYELDMRFCIFDSLRRSNPSMEVEVETLTKSTYKQIKSIPIGELNDYSVERNLAALAK